MGTILGLDIGGANLKAATPDKRAASVPFPLWKQPEKLPAALGELVARFPDAGELAVTMTGELCDCFETKRDGVNAILTAVQNVSRSRRIRVWTTDGVFVDTETARKHHLKVAAANWHALATLAGQYAPTGRAILIDVGSTTTDVIPILDGKPIPKGLTDYDRIFTRELIYTGVRRTPVCAVLGSQVAAELFATTLDAYLVLGMIPEDPADTDTADGRPATRRHARARLGRMYCGDADEVSEAVAESLAEAVWVEQRKLIWTGITGAIYRVVDLDPESESSVFRNDIDAALESLPPGERAEMREAIRQTGGWSPGRDEVKAFILSGSGEFLARWMIGGRPGHDDVSLTDQLGPEVSACAPAYAVAVLAAERP